MEQVPRIIMRCPKCSKEFPSDAVYCETCSAMLDPEEIEEPTSSSNNVSNDTSRLNEDYSLSKDEQMEDVRIDTLKTEIEGKFVLTLRRELVQLKSRLSKKEAELSGLQARKNEMEHFSFLRATANKQKDIEDIIKRTAKLESILENLRKKVEADVSELGRQMRDLRIPGPFWFFDKQGRYYKMLSAELKTKNAILDVSSGMKSPAYFSRIRFVKIASATVSFVIILFLISWYIFNHRGAGLDGPSLSPQRADHVISEKDVADLLEDIRQANMRKDLNRWIARYSRKYLESTGKKKDVLKQWKNVDFRNLKYSVADFSARKNKASALISWDMELFMKESGKSRKVSQQIRADFVIEDGRVKISSVRKQSPE